MDQRSRLSPAMRAARRHLSLTPLIAGALALTLGGCGSNERVAELEKRLSAVEAKAESAEKRAKAAESFAARVAPTPFVQNDEQAQAPDNDPDTNAVTDDSANDPAFNNEIVRPPPAPVIPGSDGSA